MRTPYKITPRGFTIGRFTFTNGDIGEYVYDSVCDGYCTKCKDLVSTVEHDARGYDCPSCDGAGTVDAVLVILELT